jgi:hypothetical protein
MRNYPLLGTIAFIVLSANAFAQHHNCNDFKNEQARQNCREHHNNRNCQDLKNSRAREECRKRDDDRDDKMYKPNQSFNKRSKTLKEAQQFCASAHTAADHESCMDNQGYNKR